MILLLTFCCVVIPSVQFDAGFQTVAFNTKLKPLRKVRKHLQDLSTSINLHIISLWWVLDSVASMISNRFASQHQDLLKPAIPNALTNSLFENRTFKRHKCAIQIRIMFMWPSCLSWPTCIIYIRYTLKRKFYNVHNYKIRSHIDKNKWHFLVRNSYIYYLSGIATFQYCHQLLSCHILMPLSHNCKFLITCISLSHCNPCLSHWVF